MSNETIYVPDEIITGVQHIHLEKGDILAVLTQERMTWAQGEELVARLQRVLPEGVKAVVLSGGATLAKVSVYKEPE